MSVQIGTEHDLMHERIEENLEVLQKNQSEILRLLNEIVGDVAGLNHNQDALFHNQYEIMKALGVEGEFQRPSQENEEG